MDSLQYTEYIMRGLMATFFGNLSHLSHDKQPYLIYETVNLTSTSWRT